MVVVGGGVVEATPDVGAVAVVEAGTVAVVGRLIAC